jgi:hypothetical protein
MSTIDEIKELPEKYKGYRNKIVELFKSNEINSISSLVYAYKNNSKFKEEWQKVWIEVSKEEGGKISLTTIGVILGSALGGVGIAAMGSAIGVPLALILGLGGFLSGTKIDSLKKFSNSKIISISIPKEIYKKIELNAKNSDQTVKELLQIMIKQKYE